MQRSAHCGLAALATPVTAALTPPTIASVATAASTFLFISSTWVDDEVMTDLLSEDLTGCGSYAAEPARPRVLVAPLWTPVGPRSAFQGPDRGIRGYDGRRPAG